MNISRTGGEPYQRYSRNSHPRKRADTRTLADESNAKRSNTIRMIGFAKMRMVDEMGKTITCTTCNQIKRCSRSQGAAIQLTIT